jgi:putative Mn2+ efflux pump MntP
VVLVVGLLFSLFGVAVGIGVSIRGPFTESNLTIAGSVGIKTKVEPVLPGYAHGQLASNRNFINQTSTLTIGPAQGTELIVLGRQPGAPVADLHLEAR